MNRISILLAALLPALGCTSLLDAGSGGAGGDTSSAPGVCDSADDCNPAINDCYTGVCSSLLHRCDFKPSCLKPECPIDDCDPTAGEVDGKAACDDADPHTADRCVDAGEGCGVCAHVEVECDGLDQPEVQAAVCDDEDECTADRCLVSACEHDAIGGCP